MERGAPSFSNSVPSLNALTPLALSSSNTVLYAKADAFMFERFQLYGIIGVAVLVTAPARGC